MWHKKKKSFKKNSTASCSCVSLSVMLSGKPPVYRDCFVVEDGKKSAKIWKIEMCKVRVSTDCSVNPEQQQTRGQSLLQATETEQETGC